MGLSTMLAQTIGMLTQDQSCKCCKVMVVCRSKGQGAGCKRTITEAAASSTKPSTQRGSTTLRRVWTASCCFTPPATVVPSNVCSLGRSVELSIFLLHSGWSVPLTRHVVLCAQCTRQREKHDTPSVVFQCSLHLVE